MQKDMIIIYSLVVQVNFYVGVHGRQLYDNTKTQLWWAYI